MAQIQFFAPAGVTSINLPDGNTIAVRNGSITADEKFCNELQAAGFTAMQKGIVTSVTDPVTGMVVSIVVSGTPPVDADGRPDGTIYVQTV